MDAAEPYKINLVFKEIEKPFNLTVRNSDEERILRTAVEMINASYEGYQKRVAGMDKVSYYAMVALLMSRRFIEVTEKNNDLEKSLENLEKEIAAYLNDNK